jgi:hypothetical protein
MKHGKNQRASSGRKTERKSNSTFESGRKPIAAKGKKSNSRQEGV